ncbi:hypothetical protein NDU88_003917 [Pleurodeles waltl]|uniref:Uncharacterized protein n=1 Tax=Pleurodeles waltl TaxID=8319 RepID=A0AAV7LIA4_PLEWA|nr:hypothetical protein NDU88_003917 [Pleurodeles waltl]
MAQNGHVRLRQQRGSLNDPVTRTVQFTSGQEQSGGCRRRGRGPHPRRSALRPRQNGSQRAWAAPECGLKRGGARLGHEDAAEAGGGGWIACVRAGRRCGLDGLGDGVFGGRPRRGSVWPGPGAWRRTEWVLDGARCSALWRPQRIGGDRIGARRVKTVLLTFAKGLRQRWSAL